MDNKEKSQAAQLKEKLFIKKQIGIKKLSADEIAKADDFCKGYVEFLDNAKIEREAVETSVKIAQANGFTEYDCNKQYNAGDKVYVVNRKKNILLAVFGKKTVDNGVRFAIAHIDSPRLDLKPNPLYEANDLALFKTHYYGGIKKYQWTAIPLALHGTVAFKDGSTVNVNIGENDTDPCFCVTDLLPHLAKDQVTKPMAKVFTGEDMNVLIGSRPFSNDEEAELVKLNILNILFEKYGILEEDFLSAELTLVPAFKARDIGLDRSMIGAYGHDDKVCAYPALMAAVNTEAPEYTAITLLVDKEETGSDGNTGMQSAFMEHFVNELADSQGVKAYTALNNSKCLSADVNAAFDPTYASAYEPNNSSYINNGVVITKYTGSGGKYDTSDASAEYMAEIRSMLQREDILWQTGELGKVDGGGGGTIAKYVANLNVDVVDLGVPVLSMHAPMEIVSKIDVYMAYRAFCAFFE
ncbi:MAG: aminopeptidase [Acutalibacteraceae bacterium]|nr:aminopeptidase [Acutalibacteraceae bacterium]